MIPKFKDLDVQLFSDKIAAKINEFPLKTRFKLFAIKKYWNAKTYQNQPRDKLLEDIDTKYFEKGRLILDDANNIIAAEKHLTGSDLKKIEKYCTPEEIEKREGLLLMIKPLPNYWLTVMQNSPLKSLILPVDLPILMKLRKIHVAIVSNDVQRPYRHYIVEFEFAENPYFSNNRLRKFYKILVDDEIIACGGDTVDWYPGMDVTLKKTVLPLQASSANTSNASNPSMMNPSQMTQTNIGMNGTNSGGTGGGGQVEQVVSIADKYKKYGKSFFLLFLNIDVNTQEEIEERYLKSQGEIGSQLLCELCFYSSEYYLNLSQEMSGKLTNKGMEEMKGKRTKRKKTED